jgi:hypothetical protein
MVWPFPVGQTAEVTVTNEPHGETRRRDAMTDVASQGSANDDRPVLTNRQGHPVYDNQNQRTVGERGPATLENYQFLEKISHFDRERIPATSRSRSTPARSCSRRPASRPTSRSGSPRSQAGATRPRRPATRVASR